MTFEELKGLALGSITVEELSEGLVQKLGTVTIAEATAIVEAVKSDLEDAIAQGDAALDTRIKANAGAISGLQSYVSSINTRVIDVEGKSSRNETYIEACRNELKSWQETYNTKFNTLFSQDGQLFTEVGKLKDLVSSKNNNVQVFATMEEFTEYSESSKEKLLKGDMAYVISVKKSYIYSPELAESSVLDVDTPPTGWIFFDEISTELDLADYAKKTEVTEGLAEKAEKVHTHEMSEVTGLEAALAGKLEASDLSDLEGKVTVLEDKVDVEKVSEAITAAVNPVDVMAKANEAAIALLNGGEEQAGSVAYKIKQVKDVLDQVDAGLRTDVDKAKEDILANAAEIAKLTAKNYILTRKQELVDVVEAQTTYELTATSVSENFIADVFVNSVRLVEGEDKDYTLVGKTLKLNKARSTGSVIQVLFTFISDAE